MSTLSRTYLVQYKCYLNSGICMKDPDTIHYIIPLAHHLLCKRSDWNRRRKFGPMEYIYYLHSGRQTRLDKDPIRE